MGSRWEFCIVKLSPRGGAYGSDQISRVNECGFDSPLWSNPVICEAG